MILNVIFTQLKSLVGGCRLDGASQPVFPPYVQCLRALRSGGLVNITTVQTPQLGYLYQNPALQIDNYYRESATNGPVLGCPIAALRRKLTYVSTPEGCHPTEEAPESE